MNPINCTSEDYDAHLIKEGTRPRWVVCAANRSVTTGRIICGARHYDTIMRSHTVRPKGILYWICRLFGKTLARLRKEWRGSEQGFIDQCGVFMDRREAYQVALASGQIKPGAVNGRLYSEDLY